MSRHEQAGVALVGVRNCASAYFDRPTPRRGQFLDPANANGGCDPKLDRPGASILGCRGKLAGGYRSAFGDGVAALQPDCLWRHGCWGSPECGRTRSFDFALGRLFYRHTADLATVVNPAGIVLGKPAFCLEPAIDRLWAGHHARNAGDARHCAFGVGV